MKKMMFTLIAMLTIAASASAMSYEQAREEALFLTDKMAYELNLSDAQYEACFEINLDYLMGVTSQYDVYGPYWERRNLDLSYILYSWQWDAFRAASYFYRPLYWDAGYWHFGIYARYPHRDYFYFGRPHFYATYRGGHSWHMNGGHSYYHGRDSHFRPNLPQGRQHFGMRNGFDRGDYRGSRAGSSTRVTGRQNDRFNQRDAAGNNNRNYTPENRGNGGMNRSNSGNFSRDNGSVNRGNINRENGGMNRNNSGNFSRDNGSVNRSNSGNFSNSSERPSRNFNSSSAGSTPSRPSGNTVSRPSTGSSPSRSTGSTVNRSAAPSRSVGSSSGSRSSSSNSGGGHFNRSHR